MKPDDFFEAKWVPIPPDPIWFADAQELFVVPPGLPGPASISISTQGGYYYVFIKDEGVIVRAWSVNP